MASGKNELLSRSWERPGSVSSSGDPIRLWNRVREDCGRETAVWQADGRPGLTFARLGERAEEMARWLTHQANIANWRGRVVALGLEENEDWLAALLALWEVGAVVLLAGVVRESGAPSLRSALSACGATGVLRSGAEGSLLWEPLREASPVPLPAGTVILKMTSGTSTTPRLLAFTTAQLAADLGQILPDMGITPADRNFGLLPWSHSYGFSNLVTPLLWAGVPLVMAHDPWPGAVADALHASRATIWPTVPALLPGLLQSGFAGTPHLRLVISAGAPLSSQMAQQFREQTGQVVHTFYGSSECGGIAYDREGRAAEVEGWLGKAMSAVRLEFSPDAQSVRVRSAAVSAGHVPIRSEDELAQGIFSLPDILGQEGGGLRLLGRRDDVLNVGGRKVHPRSVETVLLSHPGVAEAVVFGTAHPAGGDRVTALLVPKQAPVPDAEIRAWCEARLVAWQVPRAWQWVTQLPFNERGKLSRAALRAQFPPCG